MTLTGTYRDNTTHDATVHPLTRRGGPQLPRPGTTRDDLAERFSTGTIFGSHMPLDVDAHWNWSNPLNIIPAMILLLIVIALVAAIV